ncbi:universal stress protein [Desulfoscipio gibsoniae]|uniref:Universal stress protein UspA-like protein n=1 Tax=Desulfoscipio gibsoniae DSM 7213 TaxID=767817 RepID=R4KMD5_9FIRM|nr:universal stress protein [Desulfoscipio gibsoniae]AGL00796.1 universal stress protein UspA-like protein [Desulfoscipio gibsoniae DSM 7213]
MINKVLLAVDGSENALRAARFTIGLLRSIATARCTIITIVSFTREEARYLGVSDIDYSAALETRVQGLLKDTRELFSREGMVMEEVVLQGDVARNIVHYARDHAFDIIVVGTRGLSNTKGMLLGSVSYKVIQMAHCPVITVK